MWCKRSATGGTDPLRRWQSFYADTRELRKELETLQATVYAQELRFHDYELQLVRWRPLQTGSRAVIGTDFGGLVSRLLHRRRNSNASSSWRSRSLRCTTASAARGQRWRTCRLQVSCRVGRQQASRCSGMRSRTATVSSAIKRSIASRYTESAFDH
jgi:hypothetical protein